MYETENQYIGPTIVSSNMKLRRLAPVKVLRYLGHDKVEGSVGATGPS